MGSPLRSILVATDLGSGSDTVVRSAAILAARTGAELHLLHSLELPSAPSEKASREIGFFAQIEAAKEKLRAQIERTMPEGVVPVTQEIIIYIAHKAILDRAQEVSADLIVMGPHRGGAAGAHFLGTTADRVIHTAEVPCLVIKEPLVPDVRRIGVPIDFSDPSPGALETAIALGMQMDSSAGPPEIRLMYVGWPVDRVDVPDMEGRMIRPELERQVAGASERVAGTRSLDIDIDVLWANDPTEATVRWAETTGIDLLVMGTHGRGGVRRVLIGSIASSVARRTPCPVLLVPPRSWSGQAHAPRLERVLIATDFSTSSREAAWWSIRSFAPRAEHLIVHVLEVPEPATILTGSPGSREELLRTLRTGAKDRIAEMREGLAGEAPPSGPVVRTEVHEGRIPDQIAHLADDADLVIMGEHGSSEIRRGEWAMLGTTVERVLRVCPAPVLVVRGRPQGPPRSLLVAVDGSKSSLRALAWADFLRSRFDASLEVLYVEPPVVYGPPSMIPLDGEAAFATRDGSDGEREWVRRREEWIRDRVRSSGISPDSLAIRVIIGSPAGEIVREQERSGADLVLMGTHSRGVLGRVLLGSVASAVLRTATCSVLVVGARVQTGA